MYPQPATCKIYEEDLKDVKDTVKEIDKKLDQWFGPDGTVWNMNDRLVRVEGSTERAHERLDVIVSDTKFERRRLNGLAVKVGGIAALLSTIAALVIGHYQ